MNVLNTGTDMPLFHPVAIGDVNIPGNLFLAPLAGYTDRAFRSVCLQYGSSFGFTEMVSAEGLARDSIHTLQLTARAVGEQLLGIQIFMPNHEVVDRCMDNLLAADPTIIDINCGCPVPKVVKTGAGSALLNKPEEIHAIVETIKKRCSKPVSVKIRTGWDAGSINWKETSDAAASAGADMITMHARTRAMGYSGFADWSTLAQLKQFINQRCRELGKRDIPVFGSGDVFSPNAAVCMLKETGVDGVMFARGAIGNPFIFAQTKNLIATGEVGASVAMTQRIIAMERHISLLIQDKGERTACREMRKHAMAYLKGIAHGAQAKQEISQACTYADYDRIFKRLLTISAERDEPVC